MLRDVFYYNAKPNVHPREKFAKNLEDARHQCVTEHFWIINEFCDYKNFDWDFDFDYLPDDEVWTSEHNNVWPSIHQKDSGTWLCSKEHSEVIVYRNDVEPLKRFNTITDNWKILDNIDNSKWDFSWHPDPTDPPYIYKWGCKFFPVQYKPCLEYHLPNATDIKYMDTIVELLPELDRWVEHTEIDKDKFDFSWRPDPREPAYIYTWGNKYEPAEITPTLEYCMPSATEVKYMIEQIEVLPQWDRWVEHTEIDKDKFDFSWRPDPREPAYIYTWGNKFIDAKLRPTLEYHCVGATERKYMDNTVCVLPEWDRWVEHTEIDKDKFDFSWRPDPREPAYIYTWGNKFIDAELKPTLEYHCDNATERKYMTNDVPVLPEKNRWKTIEKIKTNSFDFSWRPDPREPALIYVFGNELYDPIKMPTVEYHCEGATERKYMDEPKAKLAPNVKLYEHLENSNLKDYSWLPDPDSPPYIYAWGNQWNKPEDKISIQFVVPGATEYKYMEERAMRKPCLDNWIVPDNVDTTGFDFSWEPSPADPPFIYQFGTQWQRSGGPRYVIPGAKDIKYVDIQKAVALPTTKYWEVPDNLDIAEFDFSWHPDSVDKSFIYQFGTQWALSGGPRYVMPNATEVKYIENPIAKAAPNKTNWIVPEDIDSNTFDFSWHPYAEDEPYIYQFGTQHQKTGGPRYIAPGADESSFTKYIDTRILKATKLPNKTNFKVLGDYRIKDFDYSWHPDDTEQPYIFVFGTTLYPAEVMPVLEYRLPNATQTKYINTVAATLDKDMTNWEVYDNLDVTNFDFGWRPNPNDPPFIYQFGTQWQKTGGPRYVVPGATEIKYVDSIKAKRKSISKGFTILNNYKIQDFDYSWHPDETEEPYIYVFGNNQYPSEIMPTIEYVVQGAKEIKYVNEVVATLAPDKSNWEIPDNIDITDFDFSWKPNPKDIPFIYQFGTQWQKTGGPRYIVPNATQIKYVEGSKAKALPDKKNWVMPINLPIIEFDYSWHPDLTEEPYIYIFGNQWNDGVLEPTIEYRVEGATQIKYINHPVAKVGHSRDNFEILEEIESFDFSWRPNPTDPPYIYVFGNTQYPGTIMPTIKYIVPGASQEKFIEDVKAKLAQKPELFINKKNIENFDYSWRPNPTSPPYIYVFGNQWYNAEQDSTIEYHEENAIAKKYINDVIATIGPNFDNWNISDNIDTTGFDFSWYPDPHSPPYIYQFGTMANDNDGPRYITPNTSGEIKYLPWVRTKSENDGNKNIDFIEVKKYYIETTLEDLANQHPTEVFWALNKNIDYSSFDFAWRPQIIHVGWEADYVNVFGSPESPTTHTYFINAKSYLHGKTDFKFIEDVKLNEEYLSTLFIKPEMFFVDRGNSEAMDRFTKLKGKFSNIQKTRYLNSWVDTINRCINRSSATLCWILDSYLDYSDFNFNYYPNPWQMSMVHIFGTQWSHWGTTFMVNRETFAQDTKYIKIIEHLNNINFVKRNENVASATNCLYDVFVIDHGNKETSKVINSIREKVRDKSVTTIPYKQNYLDTFKEILKKVPEKRDHYIWICSTICDYSNFNFTYICDPFARENLHVFPSNNQKFGDTFLVNINQLNLLINNMSKLQEYNKISFNNHQRVQRFPPPIIVSDYDTHVASILTDYEFPYAIFVTEDNKDIETIDEEPMNLWAEDTKNILITSTGGTRIVAPKEVKNFVETQLYDYPYIITSKNLTKSSPMDIIFVSNGELCAETNYEHLLKISKNFENKIVRIDGINGRSEALKAAAKSSFTKWFYGVPAKLLLDENFDFNYQPDRLQIPKHYVFKAHNPINDLYYGHQAMVLYNKEIVLNVANPDLDFTIESEHDIVNMNSGTAVGDTDEYSTWRTAFREAIKLQRYYDIDKDKISKQRLEIWTSIGKGNFGEWSIKGANDGIEFYKEVNGNINELRQSYYWGWIEKRFKTKY